MTHFWNHFFGYFIRAIEQDPFLSVPEAVRTLGLTISAPTARRRLRLLGLFGRRPAKKTSDFKSEPSEEGELGEGPQDI